MAKSGVKPLISDRCLCDGVGGRNGNSRLLAAAAVPIVDQARQLVARGACLADRATPTPKNWSANEIDTYLANLQRFSDFGSGSSFL